MLDVSKDLDFLKDPDLDTDHKKVLVEKLFEREARREELAVKQQESADNSRLEKQKFWHNTPLVVALVGVISVGANAVSTFVLNRQATENAERMELIESQNDERLKIIESQLLESAKSADAEREATKEERQFAFSVIEKELAKSTDAVERARTLLFLVQAGILKSLNEDKLVLIAQSDLAEAGVSTENVGIPSTLGRLSEPNYKLDTPPLEGLNNTAARLLVDAIAEINRNIDETNDFDRVKEYWTAVENSESMNVNPSLPWSGAFLSWLIKKSGNPDQLPLSALNVTIWRDARKKGLAFHPAEKPILGGDIAFFARGSGASQVEDFWSGEARIIPSHPGVVYAVREKDFDMISGNLGNAIHLTTHSLADATLVGFIRLGASPQEP